MANVVKRPDLKHYLLGGFGTKLIPLHAWDYRDQYDRERGKSPADNGWRTENYTANVINDAIESGQNLGVRLTDHDLVIDMDPRNMNMSLQGALDLLELDFDLELENAPTVNTGSGGLHVYLCIPGGLDGAKTRNELPDLPGVEFKTIGRQVVSAGSKHPNGNFYTWVEGRAGLKERPVASETLIEALKRPIAAPTEDAGDVEAEELTKLLSALDPENFQEHDRWLELMMACHSATGGAGIEAFVEWSTADPRFADDADIIRDRWHTLKPATVGGVTSATLYLRVKEAGGGELLKENLAEAFDVIEHTPDELEPLFERLKDGRPKPTLENTLEAIRCLNISPEYDELQDRVTIRGDLGPLRDVYPTVEQVWDDRLLAAVRLVILRRWRIEVQLKIVQEAIMVIALASAFNPVHDYLDSLEWDGVERLRDWMVDVAGAEPGAYTAAVSRLLIVSAVARARQPGIKYDTMVVLEGKQGCGKSTLLKILGGEWCLEGIPHKNPNDKDVIQAMQGYWFIEMEELAAMRRSDVDSLKAFLTRTHDRARFAYAHSTRDYPRRTVFVGTTNDSEYLVDSTGNRRFLPLAVGRVDLDLVAQLRDQLFAEAQVYWDQNPTPASLQLHPGLWGAAADVQDSRRISDPWEEAIDLYLAKNLETTFVSTKMLAWDAIGKDVNDMRSIDMGRITKIMGSKRQWRRGRKRVEGTQLRGYYRSMEPGEDDENE